MRSDTGQPALRVAYARDGVEPRAVDARGRDPLAGVAAAAVRAHLSGVMGLRVLEIGCGTGENLAFFIARGAEAAIGVDPSPRLLAEAARRLADGPADLIQHDVARKRLPLWRGSADLTLLSLQLGACEEPEALFAEARRLTVPGGLVHAIDVHPFVYHAAGMEPLREGPGRAPAMARPRLIADYLDGAAEAGLSLAKLREIAPSDADARTTPALGRYVGAPVLMMFSFKVYR
jgi:SAM-dependent methyltransferase